MAVLSTYNERSTILLTLAFEDEDGVAVVPTAATYRIDDVLTGTEIVARTTIGSLAASVEVEVTALQNRGLGVRELEERLVTVEYDYGAAKHGTGYYRYRVRNLSGLLASASPSASRSPSASTSPSASASPSA